MLGLPLEVVAVVGFVVAAVAVVAGVGVYRRRGDDEEPQTLPELAGEDGRVIEPEPADEQEVVDLPAPDVSGSVLGVLATVRYLRKQKRMARKGMVKWYLMDGSFPTAKFVKPEGKGGGIPEVKHDGDVYLMPREAMVPDTNSGTWVVVHKKGEADPVNIRDPGEFAISADELSEYLTQRVTSKPPSLLDRLDIDGKDALMYAIGGVIVYAVLSGGGVL